MTADNDAARTILADAQPRLIAEVRAQGLRIAESHVDLGSQTGSGGAAGGQHQSSEDHKPFVRTQAATRTETPDSSTPADDELYA
jgi:flagellar hook-length control protein FliK